jgi:hypothetical protein
MCFTIAVKSKPVTLACEVHIIHSLSPVFLFFFAELSPFFHSPQFRVYNYVLSLTIAKPLNSLISLTIFSSFYAILCI